MDPTLVGPLANLGGAVIVCALFLWAESRQSGRALMAVMQNQEWMTGMVAQLTRQDQEALRQALKELRDELAALRARLECIDDRRPGG